MPKPWIERHGKSWRVAWRVGKRLHRQNCGPLKEYAIAFRDRKLKELYAERLGLPQPIEKNWKEFIEEYIPYCKSHKAKNTVTNFEIPALNSFTDNDYLPLKSITRYMIEQWKAKMLESKSNATVAMHLRSLKSAFSYAFSIGILKENPCSGIKLPTIAPVGRVLSNEEIGMLVQSLDGIVQKAVILALYTGMRINEIITLDYQDIRNGEIHVNSANTKARRGRVIPLHPNTKAVLGLLQTQGQVFKGLSRDMIQQHLARRRPLVGRVRFHDLRHTWATRFMEKTGDLFALKAIGGWSSLKSLEVYQHLTKARMDGILKLDYEI